MFAARDAQSVHHRAGRNASDLRHLHDNGAKSVPLAEHEPQARTCIGCHPFGDGKPGAMTTLPKRSP